MTVIDYKQAGVDIEAGNEAVRKMKQAVEESFSPQVLSRIGGFASMLDLNPYLKDYQQPLMVQSIDGVGTKMMVARMMGVFDSIGKDLVSATANDIIVIGAKPLTLLDYIAADRLEPENIASIVKGMATACKDNGISLVGGETAEMPDTYAKGEYDLAGVITGLVEKEKVIDGSKIKPGDVLLGFPSSGLHTNGYSLARKIVFDVAGLTVDSYQGELEKSWGEALLEPHLNYTRPVGALLGAGIEIKGMAHITGGGLLENLPRVLPQNCNAEIRRGSWPELPLFSLLSQWSELPEKEAYKTFNMGIGLVMAVDGSEVNAIRQVLHDFPDFPVYEIGHVSEGCCEVRFC